MKRELGTTLTNERVLQAHSLVSAPETKYTSRNIDEIVTNKQASIQI